MPDPKLIFNGTEIDLKSGRNSLGRSSDNDVSFSGDSNVSRYHAEIDVLGDDCWLIDLGSANGTTLNGSSVDRRERLVNGDEIVLGGSSRILFEGPAGAKDGIDEAAGAEPLTSNALDAPDVAGPVAAAGGSAPESAAPPSGISRVLIAVGVIGIIAALVIVGAAAFYLTRPPACEATAKIVAPESGDTILEATGIEIDVTEIGCVGGATFKIDGAEFANVDQPPFASSIDPKEYPDLADGFEHNLTVELKDLKGEPIGLPSSVLLAFETREIEKPESNSQIKEPTDTRPAGKTAELSLIDVQEMSKRLVGQFSGGFKYNVSNKEFLQEIRKRTAEYAQAGYFARASRYRDVINVAYAREQNVDAALGFVLAMSRSGFNADKKGPNEGLWRMSNAFVVDNAYNGLCGTEALSDPMQSCAAKASALYMKAIVYGVFEGDPIYSAVVFGKSPQDAGAWKASLPANRTDLWASIRTPQEREQLVRFFAAGIVAENPQKFGLENDRPLSELYRLTM